MKCWGLHRFHSRFGHSFLLWPSWVFKTPSLSTSFSPLYILISMTSFILYTLTLNIYSLTTSFQILTRYHRSHSLTGTIHIYAFYIPLLSEYLDMEVRKVADFSNPLTMSPRIGCSKWFGVFLDWRSIVT